MTAGREEEEEEDALAGTVESGAVVMNGAEGLAAGGAP